MRDAVEIMQGLQLLPQQLVELVLAADRFAKDRDEGDRIEARMGMAGRKASEALAKQRRTLDRPQPIADFEFDAFSVQRRLCADTGERLARNEGAEGFDECWIRHAHTLVTRLRVRRRRRLR